MTGSLWLDTTWVTYKNRHNKYIKSAILGTHRAEQKYYNQYRKHAYLTQEWIYGMGEAILNKLNSE